MALSGLASQWPKRTKADELVAFAAQYRFFLGGVAPSHGLFGHSSSLRIRYSLTVVPTTLALLIRWKWNVSRASTRSASDNVGCEAADPRIRQKSPQDRPRHPRDRNRR